MIDPFCMDSAIITKQNLKYSQLLRSFEVGLARTKYRDLFDLVCFGGDKEGVKTQGTNLRQNLIDLSFSFKKKHNCLTFFCIGNRRNGNLLIRLAKRL